MKKKIKRCLLMLTAELLAILCLVCLAYALFPGMFERKKPGLEEAMKKLEQSPVVDDIKWYIQDPIGSIVNGTPGQIDRRIDSNFVRTMKEFGVTSAPPLVIPGKKSPINGAPPTVRTNQPVL